MPIVQFLQDAGPSSSWAVFSAVVLHVARFEGAPRPPCQDAWQYQRVVEARRVVSRALGNDCSLRSEYNCASCGLQQAGVAAFAGGAVYCGVCRPAGAACRVVGADREVVGKLAVLLQWLGEPLFEKLGTPQQLHEKVGLGQWWSGVGRPQGVAEYA